MKISKEQAIWLAEEVQEKLKKTVRFVSEEELKQLQAFVTGRQKLVEIEMKAEKARQEYDKKLKVILGEVPSRLYHYDSLAHMVEKIRSYRLPTISTITKDIVLGAMFDKDDDLQSFINKIVKKFTPSKQRIKK